MKLSRSYYLNHRFDKLTRIGSVFLYFLIDFFLILSFNIGLVVKYLFFIFFLSSYPNLKTQDTSLID
jgi:hypothetical protein